MLFLPQYYHVYWLKQSLINELYLQKIEFYIMANKENIIIIITFLPEKYINITYIIFDDF